MTNNHLLSHYAYLAEASYADLSQAYENGSYNLGNVGDLLTRKENGGGNMGSSLSSMVVDNYSVIAHWKDRNNESGFSATLFKGKEEGSENANNYVIAMKGTDGGKDIWETDVRDIVNDGLAHKQIVDLYNFWQQITNEKGKSYQAAVIEVVSRDKKEKISTFTRYLLY